MKIIFTANNLCIFTVLNEIVKYISLLVLLLFVISCGNKKESKKSKKSKPLMGLVQTHSATENVNPQYAAEIKDWEALKAVDSFFVKYRNITPNEALSNAIELKDLVKDLIDSERLERFSTPAINARINILYNEALRLADLTEIAAIKSGEVNLQVAKTMVAFSNVNIKINTVVAKLNFENEVDITIDFIGLDTTRLDAVSKEAVFTKREKLKSKKGFFKEGSKKRTSKVKKVNRNRTFSEEKPTLKPILKPQNSKNKFIKDEILLQEKDVKNRAKAIKK